MQIGGGEGGAESSEPLSPISYQLSPFFSYPYALFCNFLHFFAVVKTTTLFFSWDCALFDRKPGGVGGTPTGCLVWCPS